MSATLGDTLIDSLAVRLRDAYGTYDNPTADAMAELLTHFVHDPAFFGDDLRKVAEARMPRATRPDSRALAQGNVLRRRDAAAARRTRGLREDHSQDVGLS